MEPQLRKTILKGLENDTRWSDIVHSLQSDNKQKVLKQGLSNFHLANSLLEMQNKNAQDNSWKVVIPNDPEINKKFWKNYILYHIPVIWGIRKRSSKFRRVFTGQT